MEEMKYSQIYRDLSEKIKKKEIKPNSLLPSEHLLSQEFEASRGTIRKALNLLTENGYIHKKRGKGSIVLEPNQFELPVSGLVSFNEVALSSGNQWETHVHELDCQDLQALPFLKSVFINEKKKEKVWKIIRTRSIDSERVILDTDFLLHSKVSGLTKEIGESSLYDYIEKELGLVISFAKKKIVVEEVSELDKKYLDLNGTEHVVVVKNHVYLDDAAQFQYTESRHRLDKFSFVDFARRKQYEHVMS